MSSMIRKQLRESFFLGVFALVTVCLLSPSASAIKISDNFSVDGFLDMSAGATIAEDEDGDSELTAFAGYDQLELALKFSFDKLSGRADIDGNDSIGLEQAYITYAFSDMVSINAGESLEVAKRASVQMGITWPVVLDTDASIQAKYKVTGIPLVLILDANGLVRHRNNGVPSDIHRLLDGLLG